MQVPLKDKTLKFSAILTKSYIKEVYNIKEIPLIDLPMLPRAHNEALFVRIFASGLKTSSINLER